MFYLVLTLFLQEYPPSDESYSQTFKALVSAIQLSSGLSKTQEFLRDFLIPQLVGVDICDVWDIRNPMGVLREIVEREGGGEIEPRLTRRSGDNTMEAVYSVAIYIDKEWRGEGRYTIIRKVKSKDELIKTFLTNYGHFFCFS